MAKKFKLLQEKMSVESRARAEAKAQGFIQGMALDELRAALDMTQAELAKKLRKKQPAISKIENSLDMYVSTLEKTIKGMGGTLDIIANFSGTTVRINQFSKHRGRKRKLAQTV